MSTATYALRRNQNLAKPTAALQLGPVSLSFVVIAVIGVLALLYLNGITRTSTFGYKVSELQKERTALQQKNQELQVEAARLSSIQRIQNSPTVAKMVPEQQVSYAK